MMFLAKMMVVVLLPAVSAAADKCCSGHQPSPPGGGVNVLGNYFWGADGGQMPLPHASHGGENAKAVPPEVVEISENALESMLLSTVRPERRRMRSTVSMLGRMELASDARSEAPAPIAGRISLKVRELDRVETGTVLFTVDSPAVKSLSHEIEVLESRLQVYRKLKTTNAEIESALKVKKSEKSAMLAGADETGGVVSVRAVRPAMVEKLNVADGAWVEIGAAAVSLVCPRTLRFRALVAAPEASRLRDGMKVTVSGVEADLRLGIGDGGTVPVYAVFGYGAAPGRAGDRMRAECVLDGDEAPVWALPDDCLVKVGAETTVFVRDRHRPARFFAVSVRTGISAGGWVEVDGLPDGNPEIVQAGAYGLKLALSAKSAAEKPVGHFHADGSFHEGDDH